MNKFEKINKINFMYLKNKDKNENEIRNLIF